MAAVTFIPVSASAAATIMAATTGDTALIGALQASVEESRRVIAVVADSTAAAVDFMVEEVADAKRLCHSMSS